VRIFAIWAGILAFLALANLLILTQVVETGGYEPESLNQIWLIFGLNVIFGLGFAASAYGLWRKRNWGRLLFLGIIVAWSAFNIIALFSSQPAYSAGSRAVNSLRYLVGPVVSWWYLNLARIKHQFQTGLPVTVEIEEDSNE
jgi:hypothetical protein